MTNTPPIWLGIVGIVLVLAIISYVIASEMGLGENAEGFHNGGYPYYPYPSHGYLYDPYPYPPPNPYLYPGAYSPYRPYYPSTYYGMYYNGLPRYIPYDPIDPRLPLPIDGHTQSYYYDRYRRHADANKANNPYKYHYDAEGEIIPSEDAMYYDHQPWNVPTARTSGWWSNWIW